MVPRTLATTLLRSAQHYPVLCLTGPRQSGKTTLLQSLWPDRPYLSLEDPDVLEFAQTDPRGFLSQGEERGLIIDEAQRHPTLFNYLQGFADRSPPGRYLVSGSNNFLLLQAVSQSLAGRAGVFHLLPFSMLELGPLLDDPTWEQAAFRGFYPRVRTGPIPAELFAKDYLSTYAERDVRLIRNIQELSDFRRFLSLCAGRAGQLLNLTSLAHDAGLSVNTTKDWLSLLEASFLVFFLRPWSENFNKRLIKAPKLYWHDTSLLCRLLEVRGPEDLQFHPLRGAVFENLVVAERFKLYSHRGETPPLWYWRDSKGVEIDLVERGNNQTTLWEAKAGQTLSSDFFKNLETVGILAQVPPTHRRVVYGGLTPQTRTSGTAVSWRQMD